MRKYSFVATCFYLASNHANVPADLGQSFLRFRNATSSLDRIYNELNEFNEKNNSGKIFTAH